MQSIDNFLNFFRLLVNQATLQMYKIHLQANHRLAIVLCYLFIICFYKLCNVLINFTTYLDYWSIKQYHKCSKFIFKPTTGQLLFYIICLFFRLRCSSIFTFLGVYGIGCWDCFSNIISHERLLISTIDVYYSPKVLRIHFLILQINSILVDPISILIKSHLLEPKTNGPLGHV